MPKSGDSFISTLKKPHLGWGTHRKKQSRSLRAGEGYIHIPAKTAKYMGITNSNSLNSNIYKCSTSDGFLQNEELLASGSSRKGYKYAKQFQGKGNLRLLGGWYKLIQAKEGDRVKVEFLSSIEILLTKL